jgi:hypothetical protein
MYANMCVLNVASMPCDVLWVRFPGPWSMKGWAWLFMLEDAKREDQRRAEGK